MRQSPNTQPRSYSLTSLQLLIMTVFFLCAGFALHVGACAAPPNNGEEIQQEAVISAPREKPQPEFLSLWGDSGSGQTEVPEKASGPHLAACTPGNGDCPKDMLCASTRSGTYCFYSCDPRLGTRKTQNPACIPPENCNEAGFCTTSLAEPAAPLLKEGKRCLLRMGYCEKGFLCVGSAQNQSVGTCEKQCNLALPPEKNECKGSERVCKKLLSGEGACLRR